MNLPFVSCICPTYNRPPDYQHLLEEAIECFLRQDYPADRRELIILNDCPGQKLACGSPGVCIHNYGFRMKSLGAKYNYLAGTDGWQWAKDRWVASTSLGDIIVPWEDDDTSLPGRVGQAVDRLQGFMYFNPQRTWFLNGKDLHSDHSHGVCHNAGAYTRGAWAKVGGYPEISGAQDAYMDQKLKLLGRTAPPLEDDPSTWTYIYRWGVSPVHLSGRVPHDEFYAEVGRMPVKEGAFTLRPHWRQDYVKLTQEACKKSVAV